MSNVDNAARIDALAKNTKWLNKVMWIHLWGTTACFTMERMMAPGIVMMFAAIAEDLYPGDKEKQIDLLQRHNNFYNTQPNMTIVPGVVVGLEMERAKGNDVPNELIQSMKAALAGPFAGIGDALVQGMFVPIILSIGMSLSANGSAMGAIFAIVAFFGIMWPLDIYLLKLGITMGASGAEMLLDGDMKERAMGAISALGCIVVGAVTASTCSLAFNWTIKAGDLEVVVENYMNQIYPGLTVILAWALVYFLMRYKKIGAVKMLGLIFVISAIGYFLHIF